MRCLTYDDGKVLPGIRFQSVEGIRIADQTVGFDESLIFDPTCHFGQYIVRASARKNGSALSLAQPEGDAKGALLRVFIPLNKNAEVAGRVPAGVAKLAGGIYDRIFYRGTDRRACPVFEGLIQFDGPGEFTLVETIAYKQTRAEVFVGMAPGEPLVRKLSFRFDGSTVSVSLNEPEGTAPVFRERRFGMYDEFQTIELIGEMLNNQHRIA